MDGHLDILREISRWKVISMRSLYDGGTFKISYQMYCRKIKKLESEGLVRSMLGARHRKFITLTKNGSELCPYGISFDESQDSLNHDLIATNVVSELIKNKNFTTGQVHCFGRGVDFEPDGVVFGSKNGLDYTLAIEVELHQKSKNRLKAKLVKYSNCADYSYVLYVINKESIYRKYKSDLSQMTEPVRRKVILLFDINLKPLEFDYEKGQCFFKGKETTFSKIFGDGH